MLERTTVVNTNREIEVGADIIRKTPTFLKVSLDGTNIALDLRKNSPNEKLYVAQRGQLEFTSTGK